MLYLNNSLLSAHGIVDELNKLPANNKKAIEAYRNKLGRIYFPQMTAEKIKAEIESERFAEFPQLQAVLRKIFSEEPQPQAMEIPLGFADWNPSANYTNKTFQELNNTYGYFQPDVSLQGEMIFNTLKPLCRKMTQLVERQADDNEMAYKLMALFCEPEDLLDADTCLKKIATDFVKISQQIQKGTPYHDAFVTILHSFPTATDVKNIQEWRQFILQKDVGFSGLRFFADCASFESVPKNLKEAQTAQLAKSYPRANENIEFAKFCKSNLIDNEGFEAGLDFVNSGWPKKEKDNLPLVDIKLIDESTNTEYRWVKLPPDDWRALYLGNMIPGCCQFINGHSRQCVIDGITLADNGFYVLLKKKIKKSSGESADLLDGDIVAQAYTWISKNGNLCLDSIEWDEARVTEPIIKTLMDKFALEVFQKNPQIRYVNVGTGGQTPHIFGEQIKIPERQRQGTAYGDASSQFCIKSRLNPEDAQKLQTQLTGLDEKVEDKILYLAPYFASTEFSPDMIQKMSKLLTSSFFQPFPKVPPLLTALDFETLTFEEYQQLPDDKKTQVSTFCKLLNCGNFESFVKWLPEILEKDRLEAVKSTNQFGDTVLHLAAANPDALSEILGLLPEQDRLEAVKATTQFGQTVLHSAAQNPKSLREILGIYPEQKDRLEAVKATDQNGRTVLDYAAQNPESLEIILGIYTEQKDRLGPVKATNQFGDTVLHLAAQNPESLKIILGMLLKSDRLEAVKATNQFGQTVLHSAAGNPESLKIILGIYPDQQARLEAVNAKDKSGNTVLHYAAKNPESLKIILGIYPDQQARLEAVKAADQNGRTVLHSAAQNPESLKIILGIYPKQDRLEAVNATKVLHYAAKNPESLTAILGMLKENDRLKAVNATNQFGQTVLDSAAGNPESLKAILGMLENDCLKAVKATDQFGQTVLHSAAKNPKSLREILGIYPEQKDRLEAVKATDQFGKTVLDYAAGNNESLKAIRELAPGAVEPTDEDKDKLNKLLDELKNSHSFGNDDTEMNKYVTKLQERIGTAGTLKDLNSIEAEFKEIQNAHLFRFFGDKKSFNDKHDVTNSENNKFHNGCAQAFLDFKRKLSSEMTVPDGSSETQQSEVVKQIWTK